MQRSLLASSCVLFTLTAFAPGCAFIGSVLGTNDSASDVAEAARTAPTAESLANIDEAIATHLSRINDRPLEPWSRALSDALSITQDINLCGHEYKDEAAQKTFLNERFGTLQSGYTSYLEGARKEAIANGDPELGQALTAAQMQLQTDYTWYVEPVDTVAQFREDAEGIAAYRGGMFEEKGEYTKLNELTCIASAEELRADGKVQDKATWHFSRTDIVHVRCLFPVSVSSLTGEGFSPEMLGEATAWGRKSDELANQGIAVAIEADKYWKKKYFDFAFDLGELTKTLDPGYVRINGFVRWMGSDSDGGFSQAEAMASMRISFE